MQIEQAARAAPESTSGSVRKHLQRCPTCQARLQAARADAELIRALRELQETRESVKPLAEELLSE
jgi:predicted anti-sigma-YlaC factor YlaD